MAAGPVALARLAQQLRQWPALLRDAGGAGLALASVCLGEVLILLLPLHAEVVLALPGLLLAGLVFGGASAGFGLVCAALAVNWAAAGRPLGLLDPGIGEAGLLLALALCLLVACLGLRLRSHQRERRAELLMDACARDAAARIVAAEARLAQAESDAAAARASLSRATQELALVQRSAVQTPRRDSLPDGGLDEALRREGGV